MWNVARWMPPAVVGVSLWLGVWAAPVGAQTPALSRPSTGLMPNPNAGRPLYATHCASCHGALLQGTDKGPPFLHKVYEPSHHGDAAFQMAVQHGTRAHHWRFGDMKPLPGVSADEVAHITAYIRAAQRQAGIR